MPEQESKKTKSKKVPKQPEVLPRPRTRDYIKAILGLMTGFVRRHKLVFGVALLVAAGLIGLMIWNQRPGRELTNDEIIISAGRQASISGDGNPSLLRVTDKSQLNQPFLDEAEQGDIVLLYFKAKKAVIFRPSENKVVKVGEYTPPDAKIFVRQGGHNENKVEEAKQQIDKITEVEIVSQDHSTNQLNDKTVVVDLSDRYPEKAQEIAKKLGTEVVRLPKGESIPDADILVIVGSN